MNYRQLIKIYLNKYYTYIIKSCSMYMFVPNSILLVVRRHTPYDAVR